MNENDKRVEVHELSSDLRIAVGRLSRRIRAEKSVDELSDGQYSTLALVYREGPLTLGECSELERVTPPSMNRRINSLVDLGYVTREPAPGDRRKVLLTATDAGADVVLETRHRRDAWLYQRLDRLDPEQRELLSSAAALLREVADS
jgi:DNA-binding MarR family transcriptional regulator